MDAEEDDDDGGCRPERVATVDAAGARRPVHGAAAPEEHAVAGRPPPALLRERGVPPAVGARVPRRPRQALLLLPPFRLPVVIKLVSK